MVLPSPVGESVAANFIVYVVPRVRRYVLATRAAAAPGAPSFLT